MRQGSHDPNFGLLNVNKPSGPTSHDIVAGIRRGTGERRVGHAGTLDPLAQGVLVLALGPATRLLEYLAASSKTYLADVTLGITTDTYDAEGEITGQQPVPPGLNREQVDAVLAAFRGEIEQVPPVYSAIKVGGTSAHARARAGEDVQLYPRPVSIYDLQVTAFEPPKLSLSVTCSPGTYIRSLAHDLGQALHCGAMLSGLARTASGRFLLEDAVDWETLHRAFETGTWRQYLLPADLALDGTPRVILDQAGVEHVRRGRPIPATGVSDGLGRAYLPDGRFVAVLSGNPQHGVWQPKKVFAGLLNGH
jgi:tRNA pseudouridine55 synthase